MFLRKLSLLSVARQIYLFALVVFAAGRREYNREWGNANLDYCNFAAPQLKLGLARVFGIGDLTCDGAAFAAEPSTDTCLRAGSSLICLH